MNPSAVAWTSFSSSSLAEAALTQILYSRIKNGCLAQFNIPSGTIHYPPDFYNGIEVFLILCFQQQVPHPRLMILLLLMIFTDWIIFDTKTIILVHFQTHTFRFFAKLEDGRTNGMVVKTYDISVIGIRQRLHTLVTDWRNDSLCLKPPLASNGTKKSFLNLKELLYYLTSVYTSV